MANQDVIKHSSDFLFVFEAIQCNPNGDPDQENKPRMDYDTQTNLVTDTRVKRFIRDYLKSTHKEEVIFVDMEGNSKVSVDSKLKAVVRRTIESSSELELAFKGNPESLRTYQGIIADKKGDSEEVWKILTDKKFKSKEVNYELLAYLVRQKFIDIRMFGSKGAVFVEELEEVPSGSTVIFSAHGVSQAVRQEAEARGLKVFDATCPLVTKVHVEVAKMRANGKEIIMIGHKGHPEVEGTMGQATGEQSSNGMYLVEKSEDVAALMVKDPDNLAFVTQTTLSVDDAAKIIEALKQRFPTIQGPKKDDICYATQNRQDAVKALAQQSDVVIIVGSPNSSNSNRLREVAELLGVPSYMVDTAADLQPEWVAGKARVGLSAGASAPEVLVQAVIDRLRQLGASEVKNMAGVEERVVFPMPKGLNPIT